jgi:hypothetical protein
MWRSMIAFLVVAPLALAATPGQQLFAVAKDKSLLRYHVTHKLHAVDAESHELDGKAALQPDGTVQIMVRAPISGFRSGDSNRDTHMFEAMEAHRFPFVTFKGLSRIQAPAKYPATIDAAVQGELDLHGRKQAEAVQLRVEMRSATEWHVTGGLKISLDKYAVERPSLLLVKLEDECTVDLDLQLAPAQ